MSDPDIALIQSAAEALNTTDARINAFLDNVDADVLAAITEAQTQLGVRQAAYDALASDLVGIVHDRMNFSANWRPGAANVPGYNGSYQRLQDLLDDAPDGAKVYVSLHNDETYVIDDLIHIGSRYVSLRGQNGIGEASRPLITIATEASGATTIQAGGLGIATGVLDLQRVNFEIEGKKEDLPFASGNSFIRMGYGITNVVISYVKITSQGADFIDAVGHSILTISLRVATFDGPFSVVADANDGAMITAVYAATYLNGAVLQSGATGVGTYLEG